MSIACLHSAWVYGKHTFLHFNDRTEASSSFIAFHLSWDPQTQGLAEPLAVHVCMDFFQAGKNTFLELPWS